MGKLGLFFTINIILVAVLVPLFGPFNISNMKLADWATYFSGVTAPLAFFWLIIGYRLQHKEVLATNKYNQESISLQKINLIHNYTMDINIENVTSDVQNENEIIIGLTIINNGHELRNFEMSTDVELDFLKDCNSEVFQANESRRFQWVLKNRSELSDRIIVKVEYTDIEYLHKGTATFTLHKQAGKDSDYYRVTRGKYTR